MASQRPDIPERIASVETAVQYLTQSQIQSDKRFDRLEDKVDRLNAKDIHTRVPSSTKNTSKETPSANLKDPA